MILTIDEGTTSTRALMISHSGEILDYVQKEIPLIFPEPSWVEQDAGQIWQLTLACCRELIQKLLSSKKITKDSIQGIAITNQRETSIVWDKHKNKAVYQAISWQCKRTESACEILKQNSEFEKYIQEKTGLLINCYFSATKLSWIIENIVKQQEHKLEDLLFGTVDSWLIWNLTQGQEHLTDSTNAARTMLFDIESMCWDKKILETLEIKESLLPKVIDSRGRFGTTTLFKDLIDKELPILAVIGDQQAALHAYNNEAKITYGTGSFIMLPFAGNNPQGLLKTIAYSENEKIHYALEGSIFMGASLLEWLKNELGMIENPAEIEALIDSANDNAAVYLIPALAGLGAPYWRNDVKGAIFGLIRSSTKADISKAALEAIAFRVKDIFETLTEASLKQISHVNVDGGASRNNYLMQTQANLLNKEIRRYSEKEMTALGAAKMTGKVTLQLKAETSFQAKENLESKYQVWKDYLGLVLG